jgi:hypothetical protein
MRAADVVAGDTTFIAYRDWARQMKQLSFANQKAGSM